MQESRLYASVRGALSNERPYRVSAYKAHPLLRLLTTGYVQVFGRRQRRSRHTLRRPAAEKRQGTKSRREMARRQRGGRPVPQPAMGIWGRERGR
jgi:hypothetical protein